MSWLDRIKQFFAPTPYQQEIQDLRKDKEFVNRVQDGFSFVGRGYALRVEKVLKQYTPQLEAVILNAFRDCGIDAMQPPTGTLRDAQEHLLNLLEKILDGKVTPELGNVFPQAVADYKRELWRVREVAKELIRKRGGSELATLTFDTMLKQHYEYDFLNLSIIVEAIRHPRPIRPAA